MRRVEKLFIEHVDAVYNVAYRIVWNASDAEDVVQRTFLKAIVRLDQLHDPCSSRPWLLQISYREAISTIRGRREIPTPSEDWPETSSSPDPANDVVARDVAHVLSALLASMNEQDRMAVVLRDVEQLSMTDVANVLGVGLSAAKMRVHRGRAALRHLASAKELR